MQASPDEVKRFNTPSHKPDNLLMDHSLYPYAARAHLAGASPAAKPSGGPTGMTAFAVLFLEHWEFEPPEGSLRDPRFVGEFGSFQPDYRSWSQREYGLRTGVFRVMQALQQAGIRPAIAANAMAVQRLPNLVAQFNEWGCEWLGHGLAATRMMHSGQSLDEQRSHIEGALEVMAQATGQRPRGWVSQDWGTTPDTPGLLAQAGISYTLDWVNDDQPSWMSPSAPGQRRLLSIPLSAEWDDVQCQWLRNMEPVAHAQLAAAAFGRLAHESQAFRQPTVFGLALHPWLCGMPSRVAALRGLLGQLRERADVRWTEPGTLFDSLAPDAGNARSGPTPGL